MGALGVQDWLAFALAALALGWLVWRALRKRRGATPGCGDCPGCGAASQAEVPAQPNALVTIAPPPER